LNGLFSTVERTGVPISRPRRFWISARFSGKDHNDLNEIWRHGRGRGYQAI